MFPLRSSLTWIYLVSARKPTRQSPTSWRLSICFQRLVRPETNQTVDAEQYWCGARDRFFGPLALSFDSDAHGNVTTHKRSGAMSRLVSASTRDPISLRSVEHF